MITRILQKNKGITLVALVITIIILLILVGITIAELKEVGLFEKAKLAKEKYEIKEKEERNILTDFENIINRI